MDESLRKRIEDWIAEDPDPGTRRELTGLLSAGDERELQERFDRRLEFGTAGLRGLLGGGPGRMNRSLVRRVTAGLAAYLLETVADAARRGVVVGFDGRHMSPEFAEDAAAVLAGAGIKAHVFLDVCTTPLAAFTVEHLNAAAGIMVTASHNPPAYNGYKVYWGNGAQIIPPHDTGISAAIDAVGPLAGVPLKPGQGIPVPEEVVESYEKQVLALCPHPETPRDLRIVYTALHGVGASSVTSVFRKAGFDLTLVEEQAQPDPDFPTVEFPNPEEPGAMDLALACARRVDADLVLANDPDADRLAVIVADGKSEYRALTGNQIGALMAWYLLQEAPRKGRILVATTVVSSRILSRMAEASDAEYAETLTGFKWIANKAIELKESRGLEFLFGFEEALGYTVGELVRDKDGVGAALVFADMTAWLRSQNTTVLECLESIYRRFGLHAGAQHSITLPGSEGAEAIRRITARLREEPPGSIAGSPVSAAADLQSGVGKNLSTGKESPLDLPASNVLRYDLADGTRILVRPSGTEPKIKFYVEVVMPLKGSWAEGEAAAKGRVDQVMEAVVDLASG